MPRVDTQKKRHRPEIYTAVFDSLNAKLPEITVIQPDDVGQTIYGDWEVAEVRHSSDKVGDLFRKIGDIRIKLSCHARTQIANTWGAWGLEYFLKFIDFTLEDLKYDIGIDMNICYYDHWPSGSEREFSGDYYLLEGYDDDFHNIRALPESDRMGELLLIVAHEIVHAQQYEEGRLVSSPDGHIWEGELMGSMDWKDRPWEKEASERSGLTLLRYACEKDKREVK